MFPSPMTFRFIEDEGGGSPKLENIYVFLHIFYFYMGGSFPLSPTPSVLAPLVYEHTVKYFELQTAFWNAIDYSIVNCILKTNCPNP